MKDQEFKQCMNLNMANVKVPRAKLKAFLDDSYRHVNSSGDADLLRRLREALTALLPKVSSARVELDTIEPMDAIQISGARLKAMLDDLHPYIQSSEDANLLPRYQELIDAIFPTIFTSKRMIVDLTANLAVSIPMAVFSDYMVRADQKALKERDSVACKKICDTAHMAYLGPVGPDHLPDDLTLAIAKATGR